MSAGLPGAPHSVAQSYKARWQTRIEWFCGGPTESRLRQILGQETGDEVRSTTRTMVSPTAFPYSCLPSPS